MTYTPSQNEVVISGLDISSGGQNWAGETVIIPLTVSTPQQFYVLDSSGDQIKVDPTTAAQLYASSIAIKDLDSYYGKLNVENVPSTDWTPVLTSVANVLSLQSLSDLLADSIPDVIGLVVAPPAGELEIASELTGDDATLLSTAQSFGQNYAELTLANSVLNNASALLNNSYNQYLNDVAVSGQSINFSTLQGAVNGTLASLYTGNAAVQAISNVANLSNTLWDDVSDFVHSVFVSGLQTVLGAISPLASLFETPIETSFDISDDSVSLSTYQTSLEGLIAAAQSAVASVSPFSAAAIANDTTELADSLAETQGTVLGTVPTANPELIISSKTSVSTTVNTPLALRLLFTPSITQSGASDHVDQYTLDLQGLGELVVNNVVYAEGQILDVTQAEFQTAYFTSSQPGNDQIEVVGFDSAGNSAVGNTVITVGGSQPPPASAADLKVSTSSLVSSNLNAGGGGTVAFSVENLGSGAAPSSAVSQIYLSTNTTLDSSDVLVSPGSISDASLAEGASQSEQLPFTLPANVAGSYYLIVFAGDTDQVTNGAAAGKTSVIPITVEGTEPAQFSPSPTSPQPSGSNPISILTDETITTRVSSEPVITSGALRAADAQYPNDTNLRYTIVTPPANGRLIDDGYTTSTFTQADIDNDLVDYVQSGATVSSDGFSFYVSDPAGFRSPIETFSFNILPALSSPPPPPAAPNVTVELANDTGLPTAGGPASSTSIATLAGTANPGATVELADGSTALGSALADASGNWSFSPSNGFAQGGHYISADVTISGQTAANYLSFNYDTIAPSAPSTPQLALGGNVANTSTPDFVGTAEDNNEVLLLEGNSIIGSGMATPQGTWTIATSALGLGYHSITAEAIDPAGNTSPLSIGDTIEVVPPPPDEVTLNDASMIGADDLASVGTVSDSAGSITEYGPIASDGFTLSNLSRATFSFITWNSGWTAVHDVDNTDEYFDGQDTLVIPTSGIVALGQENTNVTSAPADTIDLKRADGTAFSLVSIDIGPTGDYPTSAVFTGLTADGQPITETFELNLPENSSLRSVALTGFNDVTDVQFTENRDDGGDPTSIEFDNIVVGNATPPSPPPPETPLLRPITLDDATTVSAGDAPLLSTDSNVFTQSTTYEYGPITADGFTITNIDRSDYAFFSSDSNSAAVFGYFYDGPDVLALPIGQMSLTPARIVIQRQNGSAFGVSSIELDTIYANSASQSATFTGTASGGNTVAETFLLDNVQGFQTFTFDSDFNDLTSLQFTGTTELQFNDITFAEAGGSNSLVDVGNNYFLNNNGGSGPELKSGGLALSAGSLGSWIPIGEVQTASGYDVAWAVPGTAYYSFWTTDGNGNYTSSDGVWLEASFTVESQELTFGQDLNSDGLIGGVAAGIAEVGTNYFLYQGGSFGAILKTNGTNFVAGGIGSWTPIGAVQTASGYDLAWSIPGTNYFSIWTTDSNGNYLASDGVLLGTSAALEAFEPIFNQDLNGGVYQVIQVDGSTSLDQVANNYYFYNSSNGSDVALKSNGTNFVAGGIGSWTPIGAVQTASGYDLAWSIPGTNYFSIWTTDSNGNYLASDGVLLGTSAALEAFEPIFNQDLNGGVYQVIQVDGSTSLDQVANNYYFYNSSNGSDVALKSNGTSFMVGGIGSWTPIGAVQTASGYDLAWSIPGTNYFSIWTTDSNGNYLASDGVLLGTSAALEAFEPIFNQDLNGGVYQVIQVDGSTSLDQVANNYYFYNSSNGSDVALKSNGTSFMVGGIGSWTPIGAVQTASGYDLAWSIPGTNYFSIWTTDSNGNYLASDGVLLGTSAALEAFEPIFNQDLNGDGVIGPVTGTGAGEAITIAAGATEGILSAYSGTVSFAGTSGSLQLYDPFSFSGTVAGLTSQQDTLDLKTINFATIGTPSYSGNSSGGTLSVTDGTHIANIALLGNYLASTFVTSSDGHGGTIIADPLLPRSNEQTALTQPQHA